MQKLILLLFILTTNISLNSQTFEWARNFEIPDISNESFKTDRKGNVYQLGSFYGTVDFDPGIGVYNLTAPTGRFDIYILKLDKNGDFVWAKSLGGKDWESGNSIALDSYNNVYITGNFNGILDFDPGVGVYNLQSKGGDDMFILKLDENGDFVWVKSLGGLYLDIGTSIIIDSDNNIITTGFFGGTIDFDLGPNIFNLTSKGKYDIFILKLDKYGNFVWAKSIGGLKNDQAYSIYLDSENNIYTSGYFSGTVDFDPGTGVSTLSTNVGEYDIFILKMDEDGNFVWAKSIPELSKLHNVSISFDSNDDIYVTGYFKDTIDLDLGMTVHNLVSNDGSDIFLLKMNKDGNFIWAKGIGSLGDEVSSSIILDSNDDIYITGYFSETMNFDLGIDTFILSSIGDRDIFILKLNENGNFIWVKSIGGLKDDRTYSIFLDSENNIYTSGQFHGTVDFDPGLDTFYLTTVENYFNTFILKLSQCPTTFDTMKINTCDSFTWIDGNTYTANTDTAKYILENAAGCDSIVTLDLTILHNDTVMHNITSCDQFILKNDTISNSGTYTFDTINVSGCDSTSIFNLTILKSTKEHIIVSACDSFLWKNNSFTETGIFFFDTINTAGCDSTIILDLTVNKKSDSLLQITACDSYFWHDSIITSSGIYRFDTLNTAGCDSSVSLNLTIVHTLESLDTLYICQGDTVSVFDSDFYGDTLISKTFVSSDGCDSIRYFKIITTPLPESSILKSVCEGDSVFVIDRWLSEEGEYIIRKENSGDCDSIYHVFIEKRPVLSSFDTIFICKGDTISVFGFEVFDESDLEQSFVGSNDCDSTVFVHVAVLEPVFSHSSITLCPGDSVFLNNQWVKSQGQYQEVFTGSNTCDSISNIDVTVLPKPDKPEIEINCEEATVLAKVSDSDDKDWNILWSNGDTSESTVFTGNEPAYVVFSAAPGCKIQYDFSIPLIPDLSLLPLINDTVIEAGTVLTYDIDLDTSQWAVLWTPSEIFDCNSCTSVKIQVKTTTEISLSMTHISGCTYQRVFIIDINERQLYIPDIFTPDGDGINDLWKIQSPYGIDIISCKIFDRWGELLYLSDKNIAWDGTFKGKNVSQGVYVYVIEYRDGSGEKHIVSGDITVVR